jgi:hypothetical protein
LPAYARVELIYTLLLHNEQMHIALPVNLFLLRLRFINCFKWESFTDIIPEKELLSNLSILSPRRSHTCSGNGPVNDIIHYIKTIRYYNNCFIYPCIDYFNMN